MLIEVNIGYYMQNDSPKVALITGAARRIGAETAKYLHQQGMNIALHYHISRQEAEQLCAELNNIRQNSARLFCCDLEEFNNLGKLVDEAAAVWGRLDVLINNASKFYKTEVGQTSSDAWDELMNANVRAPFFLAQAAAPYLKKTQGCIVNITDIHGDRPLRDYSVYSISKAGLIMMTKSLALELGPAIRVNAVSPGMIVWPEGENKLSVELKGKIVSRTALKCHGSSVVIAKAVAYLISDSEYMTGQVIAVDGGRSLMM
jgi:pteridine reductase